MKLSQMNRNPQYRSFDEPITSQAAPRSLKSSSNSNERRAKQNLNLINEFLLLFKLFDKTRSLYGEASAKIFFKRVRQSIRTVYDEFQTNYVNVLCGPFSVLEKLEDFQLTEHALEVNEAVEELLEQPSGALVFENLPLRFVKLNEIFEALNEIPDYKDLQSTLKNSNDESSMDYRLITDEAEKGDKSSFFEPHETMRAQSKSRDQPKTKFKN